MKWPTATLGESAVFVSGGTPTRRNPDFFRGEIPWITGADIDAVGGVQPRNWITSDALRGSATTLVPAGSVLLVTRTSVGKATIAPYDLCFSQDITAIQPHHHLDARFLLHFLRARADSLARAARGATIQGVTRRDVSSLEIPLPPLDEQRRVAAVLDRADSLLRANVRVSDSLQALSAHEFQRRFAPLGARGAVRPFGAYVSDLVGGRSLVADDPEAETPYRVLKISAVTSGVFAADESKPLPASYVPPMEHLVGAGDLLLSRANTAELVGATALVSKTPANLVLPDKLWRIVWREPDAIEPTYALALLQSRPIRQAMTRLASGTGGSMKNISKAKLMTMPFPVAPLAEQMEFAAFAQRLTDQRGRVEYRGRELSALFRSLQKRAFVRQL